MGHDTGPESAPYGSYGHINNGELQEIAARTQLMGLVLGLWTRKSVIKQKILKSSWV